MLSAATVLAGRLRVATSSCRVGCGSIALLKGKYHAPYPMATCGCARDLLGTFRFLSCRHVAFYTRRLLPDGHAVGVPQ